MAIASPPIRLRGVLRRVAELDRIVEISMAVLIGLTLGVIGSRQWSPEYLRIFGMIVAAAAAAGLVLFTWRKPVVGLIALVVGLPLHQLVFGRLFLLGLDVRVLSAARYWKEAVLGVLLVRMIRDKRPGWDSVDGWIFAFLGLTLAYVFIPMGPPLFQRFIAGRTDALFLVLLLVGRYLPEVGDSAGKLETGLLLIGGLAAALTFWNAASPEGFNQWLASTGIVDYRAGALDLTLSLNSRLTTEGGEVVRAGSFFGNALTLSYFLLLPCGLVIGRALRGVLRPFDALVGLLCVPALVLTLTRSAMIALAVMVALALVYGRKRLRTLFVVVAATVAFIPFLGSVPGLERLSISGEASPRSNAGHLAGIQSSKDLLVSQPFGTGLGTAGPSTRRFDAEGFVNESWYLQIGSELGVIGMLLFVALILIVLRALVLRARASEGFAWGPFLALAGVATGGFVLHTFTSLAISWPLWLLVGSALHRAPSPEIAPHAERSHALAASPGPSGR